MQAIDVIRKNLAALIEERATNPAALGRKAGLGYTGVRDILTGKSQNPTQGTLTKIAAALEVDMAQILGQPVARLPIRTLANATALAEDAVPFAFTPTAAPPGTNLNMLQSLFGAGVSNPATFRVTTHQPAFGYLPGDVLVADISRLPTPGEICLVTIADDDTATSHTEIRRYLPPFLVAGDPSSPEQTRGLDQPGLNVRHPITGMIRGLPAT